MNRRNLRTDTPPPSGGKAPETKPRREKQRRAQRKREREAETETPSPPIRRPDNPIEALILTRNSRRFAE